MLGCVFTKKQKGFRMNKDYEISKLQRRYANEKTSHVLHLILTLLTGGLWVVIWVLCALATYTTKRRYEKQIQNVYEPRVRKVRKPFQKIVFEKAAPLSIAERRAAYEAKGYAI